MIADTQHEIIADKHPDPWSLLEDIAATNCLEWPYDDLRKRIDDALRWKQANCDE